MGRTYPIAVRERTIIGIFDLITGGIEIIHLLCSGRPVGAVMGGVLNFQNQFGICVILTDTSFRIDQLQRGVSRILIILYLASRRIIGIGIFCFSRPSTIEPIEDRSHGILTVRELIFGLRIAFPVIGHIIPNIGSRHSLCTGSIIAILRPALTHTATIGIACPNQRTDGATRFIILINSNICKYRVYIECEHRICFTRRSRGACTHRRA